MHLPRQKCLLLIGVMTTACHEATAPPAPAPAIEYMLESFNTQPLPAVINAAGGDTTTLFSATLFLGRASNAMIVAHSRQVHPTLPPRDATDTVRYSYVIVGDSIAFDYSPPCPPNALCVMPPYGKVTSLTVTLFYSGGSPGARPTYIYRMVGLL